MISRSTEVRGALRSRQRGFLLNPHRFGGSSDHVAAAAIHAALVSYWEFEENDAGSTFNDSHGTNHLSVKTGATPTATSAVTLATGIVGRSYFPNGTNDRVAYIPRSNTAFDFPDASFSIVFWCAGLGGSSSTRYLLTRYGDLSAGTQFFAVTINGANNSIDATIYNSAGTGFGPISGVGPSTTLKLFCLTYDKENSLARMRIKGGGTDFNGSEVFSGAFNTSTQNANFCFGDWLYGDTTYFTGTRQPGGGRFDQSCVVMKALTDSEFNYLYNAGNGRSYAALVADAA